MKAIWIVFALAMSLGLAAGLRASSSAAISMNVDLAIAAWWGITVLFCLWVWHRAEPGSGDRMLMPNMMMLSATQLLWVMPRILFPDGGWPRGVGYGLALCATAGILVRLLRQRRAQRAA